MIAHDPPFLVLSLTLLCKLIHFHFHSSKNSLYILHNDVFCIMHSNDTEHISNSEHNTSLIMSGIFMPIDSFYPLTAIFLSFLLTVNYLAQRRSVKSNLVYCLSHSCSKPISLCSHYTVKLSMFVACL